MLTPGFFIYCIDEASLKKRTPEENRGALIKNH